MKSRARRFLPRRVAAARPRADLSLPPISLLWPEGKAAALPAPAPWENDLGLRDLVNGLSSQARYQPFVRGALAALNTDPAVIGWRQAVLIDFLQNPALVEAAQAILPRLADMRQGSALLGGRGRNLLLETADRLAELDLYLGVVDLLSTALDTAALESRALIELRDHLARLMRDEAFQSLRDQLPELRAPFSQIASLTIGVNLDTELRPASVVLLSVHEYRLGEAVSLLERLIGGQGNASNAAAVAPLHALPQEADMRILSPLFQDLDRLLTQAAKPVAQALKQYVKGSSAALVNLEHELAFYLGAVHLINRLRAVGVALCRPEIAPPGDPMIEIDGLVNVTLALQQGIAPVPNDVALNLAGRIAILTGPNSGGKTTYLRAVGLAQVLFQAGLLLPGTRARLTPADAILTHFPALETREQGRLAEEAERLREIFRCASPQSLVLLNETFSSTTSGEALYLAQDVLCGLRAIGLRAIYATHLVELAGRIGEIEAAAAGDSALFSLVAGVALGENGEAAPTFRIGQGMPLAQSYARDIAHRHGISLEQLLDAKGKRLP